MNAARARICVHVAALALSGSLLGACTVGPDYVEPRPATPDAWHLELTRGLSDGQADFQTWWTVLDDPQLTSLVTRAIENNLDLRESVARVLQARARLGVTKGQRVPNVDSIGTYQRQRLSENLVEDPSVGELLGEEMNLFSLGVDASWELDLWGRVRRSVQSAAATYEASVENYRDVQVTLLADVASTYVELRTTQQRLAYAVKNADLQRRAVELTSDRRAAGLVGDLDVRQAELNLARTESVIPAYRAGEAFALHRLSVLSGELPSTLYAEYAPPQAIPLPPASIEVGLPTELLRQRPDIRRAERRLAAQSARIGVATADLYPRFSISGTFTIDSTRTASWFNWASRGFGIGPTFRWNLFSGGRVRSRIQSEEAATEAALARYEQSVLVGYEDVENALVAFVQERERSDALQRSVTAASESVRLVDELYRLGLTDFQNVLVTQRLLFEEDDKLADSRGSVAQNLIRIYRSVGGGWAQ
jgi:NodT family efflux transporter outer membrane factor (OMF) lipoprotein